MGLRHDILNDPVSELELREVLTIGPNASVRAATDLMRDNRLGCVVIVDQQSKPVGKFTEGLLLKLLAKNAAALDEPISAHMVDPKPRVNMADTISKVIEWMEEHKVRFVIVEDDAGKPVGLTGQKGIIEYIADHFPRQVKVQETESKLFTDEREGA